MRSQPKLHPGATTAMPKRALGPLMAEKKNHAGGLITPNVSNKKVKIVKKRIVAHANSDLLKYIFKAR